LCLRVTVGEEGSKISDLTTLLIFAFEGKSIVFNTTPKAHRAAEIAAADA
jgi:hypothetical protein